MIIAVDFDGTCVDHQYPDIGAENPGAVRWMKRWVELGAKLVLWTCRSGNTLHAAEEWFAQRGLPLMGSNFNPGQASWSTSPKAYANIYVDDAAFGCPLWRNPRVGGRRWADWGVIGPAVETKILGLQHPEEMKAIGVAYPANDCNANNDE